MSEAVDQQEPMKFIVGNYYTGVCTDVVVVKKGESLAMQFGFKITPNFTDTTSVFLGSDKVGKDGKTNDDRLKEDLISFGCTPEGLNEGNVKRTAERLGMQRLALHAQCLPAAVQRARRVGDADAAGREEPAHGLEEP